MTLERIYHRDEQGLITIEDGKDWTPSAYLEHVGGLVSQGVAELRGWPDAYVEWHGHTANSSSAVGFPANPPYRPKEMDDGKRVNVYLDDASIDQAKRLGDGNVSAGIRKALSADLA